MAKKAEPKKAGAKPKAADTKSATKTKSTGEKTIKKTPAKAKRAPNPAFMKPMQISDELAKVVGSKPIPRTEVTKKLWAYIKKNNLQDAANKRDIIADENLKPIFGGKSKVSMFEMTKLVNKHLS